ncbi:hypothetical protein KVQ90_24990, partial [Escherichia coli]|nr:hypothetical protein [Escherichia coli]
MARVAGRGLAEGDQAAVIRWRVAAEACVAMAMAVALQARWFLAREEMGRGAEATRARGRWC